jgi:signal transduction histidine kinase
MRVVELFSKVRDRWAERVAYRLARGESVRESFHDELNRYFDLMRHAIISGDPGWLNEVLDEWIAARTQSEAERHETSLAPILGHILLSLNHVSKELVGDEDALILIDAILPLHNHALQYSSQKEADIYVKHITSELEIARATLEGLDKTKSDFISVAAHELRTPLTLIEGYSAMLMDTYPKDDEVRDRAEIMIKGVDNGIRRLREIVNDMIDVSLIDNDMLRLNYQPVWLNQLLGIATQEAQPSADGRSIALVVENFSGEDEMTFGDPERLYQALRNILTNAIKYTPDKGEISVSGRKLPGFIEIIVADTGIGIDPDDQERIFEKFGRLGDAALHSSGKVKFKGGGPGLGLPITKGIIEAHGGAIWVESDGHDEEACPGSTFHVLLPITKETPDEKVNKIFKPISHDEELDYQEVKESVVEKTPWQNNP